MFEIKKTIRLMMKVKGCSFERLAEEFNKLTDAGYSESALRLKINNEKSKQLNYRLFVTYWGMNFGWSTGKLSRNASLYHSRKI